MPEQPQGQQPSPEEMAALKEKLAKMSPEELKEFQKKQCIFCQMIDGKVQVKKVYEDDKSIAVLDINPANPGHVLLLPKEHYSVMPQIPEEEVAHLFVVARFLSNAVLKSLEASGTNIIVANGPAAGQRAQHFMIHVIPRKEGDGIQFKLPQKKHSDSDLNTIRDKIAEKLAALLKIKKGDLIKTGEKKQPQIPLAPAPGAQKEVKGPEIKEPEAKVVEAVVTEEGLEEVEEEPEEAEPEEEVEKKAEKLEEQLEEKPKKKPAKKKTVKTGAAKKEAKPEKEKKPKKKEKAKKELEEGAGEEPEEKPEEDDTQVDLDDIANVLGL